MIKIEATESDVRKKVERIVHLEHEVQKSKGIYISETKAQDLNRIIQDLSDEQTRLEQEHYDMRKVYRVAQDKLDVA